MKFRRQRIRLFSHAADTKQQPADPLVAAMKQVSEMRQKNAELLRRLDRRKSQPR